jgi:hypothetical protein
VFMPWQEVNDVALTGKSFHEGRYESSGFFSFFLLFLFPLSFL